MGENQNPYSKPSPEEQEFWWKEGTKGKNFKRLYDARITQRDSWNTRNGITTTYYNEKSNLPEFTVTAPKETEKQKLEKRKQEKENLIDLAITGVGFVPGLDTAADIVDIGRSLYKGDYSGALFGLAAAPLIGVSTPMLKSGFKSLRNFINDQGYNIKNSIDRFKNRKLRMTHVTTMQDIQKTISKGDKSLITPSWSIYKHSGDNLFMYEKGNQPVVFIGNRKIINDPNYVQMKGDQGVPMLYNQDFSKRNSDIVKEYVDIYGDDIRNKAISFNHSRNNLNYVKYNEGKYLGELFYDQPSYIIGPDTEEFKEIFKNNNFITYPLDWSKLDRQELRSNLQELIEQLYKKDKNIRLKCGGILGTKNIIEL